MTTPDEQRALNSMAEIIDSLILCEGLPDLPHGLSQPFGTDIDAEIAKARLMHRPDLCDFLDDLERTSPHKARSIFQDLASKSLTLAFTEEAASEIVAVPYALVAARFALLTIPAPEYIRYPADSHALFVSAPQDGTAITWGVPLTKISGIRAATPIQQRTLTRMHTGRILDNPTPQKSTLLHLKGNGLILSNVPIDVFKAPVAAIAKQHSITLPISFFAA